MLLGDYALDSLYFLERVFVFVELGFEPFFLQFHIFGVAAVGDKHPAALNFEGAICHRVEKISVMRNDYKCALIPAQKFLQPFARGGVEMVGRLVEE